MSIARSAVDGVLRHFTTDQAVRAGVTTAGWSVAASLGRGLLPRTPVQQAAASGTIIATHYMLGAFIWSGIASTAAGIPGQRPGSRALLTAAALNAGGGKLLEMQLRRKSGDSLGYGSAWSAAKLVSVVGLAGGLVTVSDLVVHDSLRLPRSPTTTLALDLATGGLMAGGTIVRRRRRARRFHEGERTEATDQPGLVTRARSAAYISAVAGGTALSLGTLAVGEQATARRISRTLNSATETDLGEFGDLIGHTVTAAGFGIAGYYALIAVRKRVERRAEVIEPAYQEPPTDPYVSCGPNSRVAFDSIGKEGRRFVTMRLSSREIEQVVGAAAREPVRVVVPRDGTPEDRVRTAVAELRATGGGDRTLICVAAPTGVGYVNYVMAEALEYLARGDCAIVVPQYAYVPSALALDRTADGTAVQRAVIAAIAAEFPGSHLVQFGESLGAQVAADVGEEEGAAAFERAGLSAGLYLGVPFRSRLWRAYLRSPGRFVADGRLVVVPDSSVLLPGGDRHVMINHHDDPINKFAYTMVVQRPWWLGPGDSRPPTVPKETLFRPITTFVLGMVDILNGMNTKPGDFRREGHDYRFDMREAVQKAFALHADDGQSARIESALREREREWAERRLIAKTGEKAMAAIRDKINAWGRDSVNLELPEEPVDDASARLLEYLNSRIRGESVQSSPSTSEA